MAEMSPWHGSFTLVKSQSTVCPNLHGLETQTLPQMLIKRKIIPLERDVLHRVNHKRSCSVADASKLSGRNMNELAHTQLTCTLGTPGIHQGQEICRIPDVLSLQATTHMPNKLVGQALHIPQHGGGLVLWFIQSVNHRVAQSHSFLLLWLDCIRVVLHYLHN